MLNEIKAAADASAFIDDHTIVGAGKTGPTDAGNLPMLACGELHL